MVFGRALDERFARRVGRLTKRGRPATIGKLVDDTRQLLLQAPLPGWQTWWLSFCDDDAPAGHRNLGVSIVHIPDAEYPRSGPDMAIRLASETARHMGCNPGGSVQGSRIFEDSEIFGRLVYYRLLPRAELEALDLV